MPVWHAKTEALVKANRLKVLGIVEEQHPNRAVLFMQWQQMDWPVLADPLNLLGVKAIPYTFLIDEHGIIRYKNPKPAELEAFLATDYAKPDKIDRPNIALAEGSPETTLLWSGDGAISAAVDQLATRVRSDPKDAESHFRLGVAYRKRYDSPGGKPGDFAKAVASWQEALRLNPDQYIWRRRIQQYGPRLDKPYSFYDWVNQARNEVGTRGETPHPLVAEPAGAEFAYPQKLATESAPPATHPDPDGKVSHDDLGLVDVETVAVPSTKEGQPAYRIHLRFKPSKANKVHWTNDAGRLSFFPSENPGVTILYRQDPQVPDQPATDEVRSIEFEVHPASGNPLPGTLKGTAFYYICEDVNGVCQYLRHDIEIRLDGTAP